MTRSPAVPPNAVLLYRLSIRVAQTVKSGIPIMAALKYELHHQIYPALVSEAEHGTSPVLPGRCGQADLKKTLDDSRLKARLIGGLLSAIAVNLMVFHDIVLEAADFDDLLTNEFDGAGEVALQAAMVRAIALSLRGANQDSFQVADIDLLRNRQTALVKALNEHGSTAHTFLRALPEVESLIDEFWQIESQIDELMRDEADHSYWP